MLGFGHRRFARYSIRALVVALVMALCVLTYLHYRSHRHAGTAIRSQFFEHRANRCQQTAHALEASFSRLTRELVGLANHADIRDMDDPAARRALQEAFERSNGRAVSDIQLFDELGVLRAVVGSADLTPVREILRAEFTRPLAEPGGGRGLPESLFAVVPLRGRAGLLGQVAIVAPVYSSDSVLRGGLLAVVELAELVRAGTAEGIDDGVVIVDERGEMVFETALLPGMPATDSMREFMQEAVSGELDRGQFERADGSTVLASAHRAHLGGHDWFVILTVPESQVDLLAEHPRWSPELAMLLIFGAAFVGAIGVLAMVARANLRLQATVANRTDQLAESTTLHRDLVETVRDVIYELDERGRYRYISPRIRAVLGYGPEELVGKPLFSVAESQDRAVELAEKLESLRRRRQPLGNVEVVCLHKNGQLVVLETTASPIAGRRGRGDGGFRGVHRDITDRWRAQEELKASVTEKEALLRELHHRVKNNLQVIVSLLRWQKDEGLGEAADALVNQTEERIAAMALVHEQLWRSQDLSSVDLRQYIGALVPALMRSFGVGARVDVRLELVPLHVCLDVAIPLGLVLNELIANAFAHAFPGGRSGGLRIWLVAGVDGQLLFTVEDDGVGLPDGFDYRAATSLGMKLIVNLVEHQLGGQVEVRSTDGTAVRVSIPHERVGGWGDA